MMPPHKKRKFLVARMDSVSVGWKGTPTFFASTKQIDTFFSLTLDICCGSFMFFCDFSTRIQFKKDNFCVSNFPFGKGWLA